MEIYILSGSSIELYLTQHYFSVTHLGCSNKMYLRAKLILLNNKFHVHLCILRMKQKHHMFLVGKLGNLNGLQLKK